MTSFKRSSHCVRAATVLIIAVGGAGATRAQQADPFAGFGYERPLDMNSSLGYPWLYDHLHDYAPESEPEIQPRDPETATIPLIPRAALRSEIAPDAPERPNSSIAPPSMTIDDGLRGPQTSLLGNGAAAGPVAISPASPEKADAEDPVFRPFVPLGLPDEILLDPVEFEALRSPQPSSPQEEYQKIGEPWDSYARLLRAQDARRAAKREWEPRRQAYWQSRFSDPPRREETASEYGASLVEYVGTVIEEEAAQAAYDDVVAQEEGHQTQQELLPDHLIPPAPPLPPVSPVPAGRGDGADDLDAELQARDAFHRTLERFGNGEASIEEVEQAYDGIGGRSDAAPDDNASRSGAETSSAETPATAACSEGSDCAGEENPGVGSEPSNPGELHRVAPPQLVINPPASGG